MPSPWSTKEFKALQLEWYAKLKKEGFVDQENIHPGGDLALVQRSQNVYRQASAPQREAKREYYLLIGKHANDQLFDDKVDELVMRWIADGKKIKDISAHLESIGERCHRQTIRFIIRKWENKWRIKFWKPCQMTSKR